MVSDIAVQCNCRWYFLWGQLVTGSGHKHEGMSCFNATVLLWCENTDSLSHTAHCGGGLLFLLLQWFSKLSMHHNRLKALLEADCWGPPWFLTQEVWSRARGFVFLIRSQVMLMLRVWRPHFANHCLHGLSASKFLETLAMHLLGFSHCWIYSIWVSGATRENLCSQQACSLLLLYPQVWKPLI